MLPISMSSFRNACSEWFASLDSARRELFGWSTKVGRGGGCPATAGMFELDDVEGPVRDKLLELEKQWDKILKQFIVESIASGDLRKYLDVDQFI
jgi:hypothetical protein